MVKYNFYRENFKIIDDYGNTFPIGRIEQIGEHIVFNDFTAELDREEAIHLIYKLKCREIVKTKTARYWAERVEE